MLKSENWIALRNVSAHSLGNMLATVLPTVYLKEITQPIGKDKMLRTTDWKKEKLHNVAYERLLCNCPEILLAIKSIKDNGKQILEFVQVSNASKIQPKKGFIFCFVLTDKKFHHSRVPALEQTWLPKCDAHHYYSNSADGMTGLPVHELFNFLPISYWKLFWKSRLALYYTYTNVSQDFDWYLKSDDDSYFMIDRLKAYLKKFNPNIPYLIGYRLKRNYPLGYASGGAGYILSREALRLFATVAFEDSTICKYDPWEDRGISRCLNNLGIPTEDTRTESLKQRFMPFLPDEHFYGKIPKEWLYDSDMQYSGFDIFHKELISLHHLKPSELRLIHGLLTRINSD